LAILALFGLRGPALAAPTISHVVVSDVTPVSFSVIWASSEPSTPSLRVFQDEDGTIEAQGVTIEPQPLTSGSVEISALAEEKGVMKVRVSGLTPDTTYFFQTITTSTLTYDVTHYPEAAPFLPVTTERRVARTRAAGSVEVALTNDLIYRNCYLPDGITPAEGTLLIAGVAGSTYPVSAFVGDGLAPPGASVDLNNLFSSENHQTRALSGGEPLTLTRFMGIHGIETGVYFVPMNRELAEMRLPLTAAPCQGDLDSDGDVDESDVESFAADFGRTDCSIEPHCAGDVDLDGDEDGSDLAVLAEDFGRTDCP